MKQGFILKKCQSLFVCVCAREGMNVGYSLDEPDDAACGRTSPVCREEEEVRVAVVAGVYLEGVYARWTESRPDFSTIKHLVRMWKGRQGKTG